MTSDLKGGGHAKVDKCPNTLNLMNLSTEQKWIRGGGLKSCFLGDVFYGWPLSKILLAIYNTN